jgi:HAE1 family hydrophobic/amphiphilic exporter-1
MSVAEKVVKRPVLFLIIFTLLFVISLYMVSNVAIDLFPETEMPMLMVMTSYDGASPETVEKTVTTLLEQSLVNVSGLKEMTSTSSEGQSVIQMEFNYGANLDARTNDIRDKIDSVRSRLPDDAVSPQIMRLDMSSMPILRIALKSDDGSHTQDDLRYIAENIVQDRLEQVDGVASTFVMGGRTRQVNVDISQNRLAAFSLTISGVAQSLASQNLELGAGSIEDNSTDYSIRTTGEFKTISDISKAVIAQRNGVDISLGDVAEVNLGYADENQTVYINGNSGVYIAVSKQSGGNSAAVAERVYARLDELESSLPQNVSLEITQDDTTMIRDMIDELLQSAWQGALLAMAVIFLFLRNIKSTIIIGLSIPFSILLTIMVMNFAGITLNMLTMTGLILGLGMIVDSSIVILENIHKFRERGTKPDIAAILGCQEVMSSIVSSTLTTLAVFVPIALFRNQLGMQGELFTGMIFTVAISLAASLFTAVFLVPVLSSKFLRLDTRIQKPLRNRLLLKADLFVGGALDAMTRGYKRLLVIAMRHRLATLSIVAAAFIGSVLCIPKMGLVMMPPMNEDSVTLNVTLPLGTPYEETRATVLQIQQFAIDEIKGAKNIIANVGSSGMGLGSSEANVGSIVISLDVQNQEADTSTVIQQKLRAHFSDFPNAQLSFSAGRSQQMAGSSDIDIAMRVDDVDEGLKAANDIREIIKEHVPELGDLSIDTDSGLPQVEVVIDRRRAYNMGLTVTGIANEIATSMNGKTATTFRYEGDEYNVVLRLRVEDRSKLIDLDKVFISSSSGNLIPVSNFASIEKGTGPASINHENQARTIHLTGSIINQNASNRADVIENKVKEAIADNYVLPDSIKLNYEGQWGDMMSTMKTWALIFTLAVLLVFGVMAGQYESFKDPFINLLTIPLMAIGIVGIYLVMKQNLSMFTMVGIVMLAGIVVNNGIVMVDYMNLLLRRGTDVKDAAIEGGVSRLRPVLMTALTDILGLVPMAFFPGESAMMIQPIGLTTIGGLVSATFITLFFIPVVYSLFNRKTKGASR